MCQARETGENGLRLDAVGNFISSTVLTLSNFAQHLDRYWRAGEMTMVNHLTGKSTVLIWTDYRFGTGLEDSDFTQTGLRRAR